MEETSSQPQPSKRVSKARERQQRRRERGSTGTHAAVSGTPARRTRRQLTPSGGLQVPAIAEIPYIRQIGLVLVSLAFMGALIVLVGMFKNDPPQSDPNAIWLDESWTQQPRSDEDIATLVENLREHRIGTIYAWVSWLPADGRWSTGRDDADGDFNAVEPTVQGFVEQISTLYPEAELYGWLWLPQIPTEAGSPLTQDEVLGSVSAFSLRVVNRLNFDGVFLDVEPVWNNDDGFLSLLQRVTGSVGQDALIAASAPPDWTPEGVDVPTPAVIAPGTVWDVEYKQRVALLVDQLVVQAYNSYLSQPADYPPWVAYQVGAFASAIDDLRTTTEVIISLPAFDTEPPAHDATVETLAAAINGVRNGLAEAGDASEVVAGVAIYGNWGMDDSAWDLYRTAWLGE